MEAITNYSEVIWQVANGLLPSIQYKHEWGAQVIIRSEIAAEDDSPVTVPDEFKGNVNIKNLSIDEDGTWYYIHSPGLGMKEIGSIVATGNSPEEVIKTVQTIANSIEGFDISMDVDSLYEAKKSIEKLNKAGISFI